MTVFCLLLSGALTALTVTAANFHGWLLLLIIPFFIVYAFLAFVLVLAIGFIVSIKEDVRKPRTKPLKFYMFLFNFVNSFLCVWGGARIKVVGEEKLDRNRKYLFVFNHRSNFDPMVIAKHFRKYNILMISKPENFDIPLVGKCIHKAGYMPIDRDNDREAAKTILQAAKYLKSGRYSIGICPEGKRNKNGVDILPFKRGAFKVATKADAPIAVIAVNGCENIHKNFPLKKTRVFIDVLEVIEPERFAEMSTEAISDEAALAIQNNIDERYHKD